MWKQKSLVVCLCLVLVAAGYLKNKGVRETGAEVTEPKLAVLTFDDGPHGIYTEKLLDGLSERNVKATFFLIGENAEKNPELVMRMQKEGHVLGNHTYSHVQLTRISKEEAINEIEQTNRIIEEITGTPVKYIRPPYGCWSDELNREVAMQEVLWNVDPQDWKYQNRDTVVECVEKNVKDGCVILLHDIYETSVEAALQIVDDLKEQGYVFVTVEDFLLD